MGVWGDLYHVFFINFAKLLSLMTFHFICLQELQVHESDISFMSPEYRQILNEFEKLQEEFKTQPCHLERVYGELNQSLLIIIFLFFHSAIPTVSLLIARHSIIVITKLLKLK